MCAYVCELLSAVIVIQAMYAGVVGHVCQLHRNDLIIGAGSSFQRAWSSKLML